MSKEVIYKRIWWSGLIGLLSLALFAGVGCKRMVFDDLSGCPQLVRLHLQYEDACGKPVEDKYAPLAKGKELRIFAFREDGTRIKLDRTPTLQLPPTADSFYDVTLWEYGKVTFVTLLAEQLKLYGLEQVEPKSLDELVVTLSQQQELKSDLPELWYGINNTYDNRGYDHRGTVTDTIVMPMQERLHTFKLNINGIPDGSYTLELTTPQNSFAASGLPADNSITYRQPLHVTKGRGQVAFDLMRIYPDRAKEVELRIVDSKGRVQYRTTFGEFFGLSANAVANFCERDIEMNIELESWVLVAARVLQWNLVWRRVVL